MKAIESIGTLEVKSMRGDLREVIDELRHQLEGQPGCDCGVCGHLRSAEELLQAAEAELTAAVEIHAVDDAERAKSQSTGKVTPEMIATGKEWWQSRMEPLKGSDDLTTFLAADFGEAAGDTQLHADIARLLPDDEITVMDAGDHYVVWHWRPVPVEAAKRAVAEYVRLRHTNDD